MRPRFSIHQSVRISPRAILMSLLLGAAVILLVFEFATMPFMDKLGTIDYGDYFIPWGRAAQAGIYNYRYPLPTLLFVFLPLSLLPSWTVLVWVFAPFAFTAYLFKRQSIALWLFIPLLHNVVAGQLDAWLILPFYWLFTEHPALAGVSAALLTLKPQLALLPVIFVLFRWLARRHWKTLRTFIIAMLILYVPAFIIDPFWIVKMLPELQSRASEWWQPLRGATLWGFWWHGGWTVWLIPALGALIALLLYRSWQADAKRIQAVHLASLTLVPVFYLVSFVTVIPILRNDTRALVALTLVSWLAFLGDAFLNWGGVYIVIPLMALILLTLAPTQPNPIEKTAH